MRRHFHKIKRTFIRRRSQHDSEPSTALTNIMRRQLDDVLQQTYGPHWRHPRAEQLHSAIARQEQRVAVQEHDAAAWFTLLVLRAPQATRAQQQIDKHPNGFHNKAERVLELIDFNDAYVSTVIALNEEDRPGFNDQVRQELVRFCDMVDARMFSDEQFDAITRGLSREIAVYLGALKEGFHVHMTSRRQDAMGVDMVITDRESGRTLNIDVKTPSSYHYRLKDLLREGRISEQQAIDAERDGYAREINGHGKDMVKVTLMRVDPNEVGEIADFQFVRPDMFAKQLRELFE